MKRVKFNLIKQIYTLIRVSFDKEALRFLRELPVFTQFSRGLFFTFAFLIKEPDLQKYD